MEADYLQLESGEKFTSVAIIQKMYGGASENKNNEATYQIHWDRRFYMLWKILN